MQRDARGDAGDGDRPAADPVRLRRALDAANIPALVATLYQLTGDDRWLREPYAPTRSRGMDDNNDGGLPDERQAEVRDAVLTAWQRYRDGTPPAVPSPRGRELIRLLAVTMGEPVPPEYETMMAELLGFAAPLPQQPPPDVPPMRAVVIGAGVSGLLAALRLREQGLDVTVLEKNTEVGGTWWENRYPGAGVDTPSYLYSLSFFPRAWSTHFGKQGEVQRYLQEFADAFDLRASITFGVEVAEASWDDDAARWHVRGVDGREWEAEVVVSAVGQLNRPRVPAIPGIESFRGQVFHSAQWPEGLDLSGKRVAVVGAGASAMQVVPAIADRVAHLTVVQRSPHWIAPNGDYFRPVGDDVHLVMDVLPYYRAWYRARLAWIFNDKVHPSLQRDPDWPEQHRSVNAVNDAHRRFFTRYLMDELDGRPDLQQAALPDYPPFGKRMLLDNGWYAALRRPNVHLMTGAVEAITPTGLRTSGGDVVDADVIVLCTGFEARRFLYPMRVRGRGGVSLDEVWGDEDASAYLGVTVPSFPNLFLLLGPNTALGHGGSAITISEFQVGYVDRLVGQMRASGIASIEPRAELAEQYTRDVDAAHARMIWTHPGMTNWYRNAAGRVVATLPWRIVDYRAMLEASEVSDYLTREGHAATTSG